MTEELLAIPRITIDDVDADDVTPGATFDGFLKVDDGGREKVRARSIDFGKIFSSSSSNKASRANDRDSLLHSDDESSAKDKSKNRIMRKFNNMLRRGSDVPKSDKARQSLDFSNAQPSSLLFSSASQLGDADELPVPAVPRRGSLFAQPKGTIQHTVDKDDTLPSLAARYKSTVPELKSLNRLMSSMLCPGQIIFVPDGSARETRRASDFTSDSSGPTQGQQRIRSRPCSPAVLGKVDEEDQFPGRKDKRNSVFSGEANYMTGGKTNLSGMLTITESEVRFDPYPQRGSRGTGDEPEPAVSDEINTIIGLVKCKMSAASLLHSAIFQKDDPFEKKPKRATDGDQKATFIIGGGNDDDNDDDEEEGSPGSAQEDGAEKEANVLRLTLVRRLKSDRPFVEALVKMCIPLPNYMEHYFMLKPKISRDLRKFLETNFPRKLNAPVPDPLTLKVTDVKAQMKNSNLRRKLSIAELCNLALPSLSETSHIFNDGHVRVLREFVPPKYDGRPWQLAYSTWKNGFSLKTLYRCTNRYKEEEVALIVIKDSCSEVFGGLLCGGIMRSESFYGTGESFLFTFSPSFQIHPWSKKNECFARGMADSFAMGSSEGAIGLWIDEGILHGSSSRCDTFDNDPLASDRDFTISCLEVWTFPYELNGN